MRNTFLLLVCLLAFQQKMAAQDEAIDTDRPDQTETPSIVPKGHFQIEDGFEHKKAAVGEDEFSLPSAVLKVGVLEAMEVRVITELAYDRAGDGVMTGLRPVIVGFKLNLWKEKGLLPQTSFLGQVLLPRVASKAYIAAHAAPELRLF